LAVRFSWCFSFPLSFPRVFLFLFFTAFCGTAVRCGASSGDRVGDRPLFPGLHPLCFNYGQLVSTYIPKQMCWLVLYPAHCGVAVLIAPIYFHLAYPSYPPFPPSIQC
jgi:hypothetical protein